jgi:DNA-directed RNA polymerase subunit omega
MSKLLEKVDSRYALAILAAKRARQINDYLNSIKRHDLIEVKGPELNVINEKPLSIAFNEIEHDKIGYERLEDGIK